MISNDMMIQLQSELGSINRMLDSIPKENLIERTSLEELKQETEEKLRSIRYEPECVAPKKKPIDGTIVI